MLVIPDEPREGNHTAASGHRFTNPRHLHPATEYPHPGKRSGSEHLATFFAFQPCKPAQKGDLAPRMPQSVFRKLFGQFERRICHNVVNVGFQLHQKITFLKTKATINKIGTDDVMPSGFKNFADSPVATSRFPYLTVKLFNRKKGFNRTRWCRVKVIFLAVAAIWANAFCPCSPAADGGIHHPSTLSTALNPRPGANVSTARV